MVGLRTQRQLQWAGAGRIPESQHRTANSTKRPPSALGSPMSSIGFFLGDHLGSQEKGAWRAGGRVLTHAHAPEVAQVLPDLPILGDLIKNLYDCHYDKFFLALGTPPSLLFTPYFYTDYKLRPTATLEQTLLLPSRVLAPHARFYVREMRILAYTQLLESYRSLTVDSLSRAFGVSVEFVDSELSRFIAHGRLHASIDKVHGIVETTRLSMKHAQYQSVIRQGDVLLNEVQRLSKVLY
ncbi:hypothetical protein C0992_004674 [Termitomyces sp. T32_za158]|nr:hypothetical protein C0992_004674 [Termitomyces sp. T32_za158]